MECLLSSEYTGTPDRNPNWPTIQLTNMLLKFAPSGVQRTTWSMNTHADKNLLSQKTIYYS